MILYEDFKRLAAESGLVHVSELSGDVMSAHIEGHNLEPSLRRLYEAVAAANRPIDVDAVKVVAIVEGGVVQSVYSNCAEVDFSVIDRDNLSDCDTQSEADELHRQAGFADQDDFEGKLSSDELKQVY